MTSGGGRGAWEAIKQRYIICFLWDHLTRTEAPASWALPPEPHSLFWSWSKIQESGIAAVAGEPFYCSEYSLLILHCDFFVSTIDLASARLILCTSSDISLNALVAFSPGLLANHVSKSEQRRGQIWRHRGPWCDVRQADQLGQSRVYHQARTCAHLGHYQGNAQRSW